MSKRTFDQIAEGLEEALAVVRGEAKAYKLHVPSDIDVKAIRARTGLSQKDFASTFAFGLDQLKQWEQGRSRPVQAMRAYLLLINAHPVEMVTALRNLQSSEGGEGQRNAKLLAT